MIKPKLSIDVSSELFRFCSFIELDDNEDIIFSAPFGTGKTHFLKEVFQEDKQVSSTYNVVHLFPINYSVASNDDIFDLVKYDVLFEVKAKHNDLIETDSALEFGKLLVLQGYFQSQFEPISFFKDLILKSGLVNKAPFEIFDLFKEEYEAFKKYDKELHISEEDDVIGFLKKISLTVKVKETDPISSLICKINTRAKKLGKQSILIIDDLDRIDPEHIFRIINIFSAHRDYNTREHKLGFDKVILVCDIENIRKIYAHRYGADVDFNGYISKFLSKELYIFNIKDKLNNTLDFLLQNINYLDDSGKIFAKSVAYSKYDFSDKITLRDNRVYRLFRFLVNFLIDKGILNVRDISKQPYFYTRNKLFLEVNKKETLSSLNFPILIIVDYLDTLLGGEKMFLTIIKKLNKENQFLSFEKSPSLINSPENIVINLLEEILLLRIKPKKRIEQKYIINTNRDGFQTSLIDNKELNDERLISLTYATAPCNEGGDYIIRIIEDSVNWRALIFYNLNDLFAETLEDFYQNNPSYQ